MISKLEEAFNEHKAIAGIEDVYKGAGKNSTLLVVERNYHYPAFKANGGKLNPCNFSLRDSIYIKDAVDDVIEKVLENGGDVEFVADGLLANYQRIAMMVRY